MHRDEYRRSHHKDVIRCTMIHGQSISSTSSSWCSMVHSAKPRNKVSSHNTEQQHDAGWLAKEMTEGTCILEVRYRHGGGG